MDSKIMTEERRKEILEDRALKMHDMEFDAMSPAEHFQKAKDLAQTISDACKDLQDLMDAPLFTKEGRMDI